MNSEYYQSCELCPRKCHADRKYERGFCGESSIIRVGRAALHHWEEPCISGKRGSGTVFFSGCTLRCCYCQNYNLSRGKEGVFTSEENLAKMFLNLEKQGAHNINLVTAEHFAPSIKSALMLAKEKGMRIPVILNSSGYISEKTLDILQNVIDIYLVDFKYMDCNLAEQYSLAEDYPRVVKNALEKMVNLRPQISFDEDGIMKSGVIVRHLCLPSHGEDSKNIIKYVYELYGKKVVMSIMSQYTPVGNCMQFQKLARRLTENEYDEIIDFCIELGIEDAFVQDGEAAKESFIPKFDGEGVIS